MTSVSLVHYCHVSCYPWWPWCGVEYIETYLNWHQNRHVATSVTKTFKRASIRNSGHGRSRFVQSQTLVSLSDSQVAWKWRSIYTSRVACSGMTRNSDVKTCLQVYFATWFSTAAGVIMVVAIKTLSYSTFGSIAFSWSNGHNLFLSGHDGVCFRPF